MVTSMAMAKLRNLNKLEKKLRKLAKIDLVKGLLAGGELVAAEYRRRVTVLSGDLQRSIGVSIKRGRSGGKRVEVRAGSNLPYAKRHEFGYIGPDKLGRRFNQPAHPALRPAARSQLPKARLTIIAASKAWIKANLAFVAK